MNTEIAASSELYIAKIKEKLVACFAIIHFPHSSTKKFKRGHRLVVLPEYQGFGIGHLLSTEIAQFYKNQGYRFIITSNTQSLYKQRQRDSRWIVTRYGRANSSKLFNDGKVFKKLSISYEFIGLK